MDVTKITTALAKHDVDASALETVDEIVDRLGSTMASGDVIVVMSNGGFGGLHNRLIAMLQSENLPTA